MSSRKAIQRLSVSALSLFAALASGSGAAVEPSSFEVKNAGELVAVCTTPATDPNYAAAIHFCHGYIVGAYHYYESLVEQPMYQPLFCPTDPKAPRDQFIKDFITWVKANPQYNKDRAVHVLFKYMIDKWPCTRQVP